MEEIEEETSLRRRRLDLIVLAGLVVATIALVARMASIATPEEDAAMLMRYAVNFADGFGIVFNPGGSPVDGATDLLVVPLAGFLVATGLTVENSFSVLNGAAVFISVVGLHAYARFRMGLPLVVASATALLVLTGNGLYYLQIGFTAPVFATAVLGLWLLVNEVRLRPTSSIRFAMAAVAILAGLVRPEGFIFAGLAFVALGIALPRAQWRHLIAPLAVIAAAGAAFVLWRWSYFGYPLPNPFYVKGSGRLHVDGLMYAVAWTTLLSWPALLAVAAGVFVRSTRRVALGHAVAIAAAVTMWLLLSSRTNFGGRFQYPTSLLAYGAAVSIAPGLIAAWDSARQRASRGVQLSVRVGVTGVVILALAVQVFFLVPRLREPEMKRGGAYVINNALAGAIAPYASDDRTLMITEAGLIPLRSGWHSIDAFGLNDQEIAHAGGIDQERLARENPELIIANGWSNRPGSPWYDMIQELREFVDDRDYLAANPWPEDTPLGRRYGFFVRADLDDAGQLVDSIQRALDGVDGLTN